MAELLINPPGNAPSSFARGYARNHMRNRYPRFRQGLESAWTPSLGVTGATLYDVSHGSGHGTLTNMNLATAWVDGPPEVGGYALNYDGTDDEVLVSTPPRIEAAPGLTFAAWVNATSYGTNFVNRVASFEPGNTTFMALRGIGGTSGIGFGVSLSGADAIAVGTNLMTLGEWHLLTGTWKPGEIHLYVDAVETNKTANNTTGTGSIVDHSGDTFAIGGKSNDTTRQFDGLIGDVYIWSRFLELSEIKKLYDTPSVVLEQQGRLSMVTSVKPWMYYQQITAGAA